MGRGLKKALAAVFVWLGRLLWALFRALGRGLWFLLRMLTWPLRPLARPAGRRMQAGYDWARGPGYERAQDTLGPMLTPVSAKAVGYVDTARGHATRTRRYFDDLTLDKARHDIRVQADKIDWELARKAIMRYKWANAAALLSTWSGLAFAVWFATIQGVLTAIYAIQTGVTSGNAVVAGTGGLVGGFAVLFETPVAIVSTFATTYSLAWWNGGLGILISIACGIIAAFFALFVGMAFEYRVLRIIGYREMSTREQRMIVPAIQEVAEHMGMSVVPRVLIDERHRQFPSAWTHTRHVVVTRSFLSDDAQEWMTERHEFCGVLAHEFHHYREGDAIGLGFLQACTYPIALIIDVTGSFSIAGPLIGAVANFIFWPYRWLAQYFIAPIFGRESQGMETACDLASVDAGYGPGLRSFLQRHQRLEPPRTGWEDVMCSTHPWTEFRIQAIDERMQEIADREAKDGTGTTDSVAAVVPVTPAVPIPDEVLHDLPQD